MTYEQKYARDWTNLRIAELGGAPSPTPGRKPQNFRNRVRRLLADGRERTVSDVSNALKCSPQHASNALFGMRRNGEITSDYVGELTVFRWPTRPEAAE